MMAQQSGAGMRVQREGAGELNGLHVGMSAQTWLTLQTFTLRERRSVRRLTAGPSRAGRSAKVVAEVADANAIPSRRRRGKWPLRWNRKTLPLKVFPLASRAPKALAHHSRRSELQKAWLVATFTSLRHSIRLIE